MEWDVWLADGTRRDSLRHTWEDVPDGILIVRIWDHPTKGKLVNWDSGGWYGHPSTIRMEGRVSDAEWPRVLAEAQATTLPPSRR
jgi:hypothetical protein